MIAAEIGGLSLFSESGIAPIAACGSGAAPRLLLFPEFRVFVKPAALRPIYNQRVLGSAIRLTAGFGILAGQQGPRRLAVRAITIRASGRLINAAPAAY